MRPPPRERLGRAARGAALGLGAGLVFRDLGLQGVFSYHGSKVLLVIAVTLGAAFVYLTRVRVALVALFALLAALWIVVAVTPLTRLVAHGLVRRDAPVAGDAVFVLASNVQDDGDLGSAALARISHGIAAQRAGLAPRIVVSDIVERPSHATTVGKLIRGLGLDIELHVVGPAGNTHDEAVATARLFKQRGWKRVVLVTSPLHSCRAAATFEAQGLEVVSSPAPESEYDVENLDSLDDRIRAFGPALHERLGLIVYGWRGWI